MAASTSPLTIKALNYGLAAFLLMLPALVVGYKLATGS
jgi:hypothetical protein